MLKDIKKDFLVFLDYLKDIITFRWLKEQLKPQEKEPLTKEVFIREGKKFKATLDKVFCGRNPLDSVRFYEANPS